MAVHVEQLPGSASLLPALTSALAVVAHPDDESFALGAVLSALVQSGCRVSVLCLTRGEASTVHGISGDLRALRAMELRDAASALGLSAAELSDHPDGGLGRVSRSALGREVRETALRAEAQGLVVFDDSGVTGHSDHIAASEAALDVATELSLPVLGWTLPISVAEQLNAEFGSTFTGHRPIDVDLTVPVERDKQRMASLAHASQAVPTSVLWRRLELLGDVEHLRWLKPPVESSQPVPAAVRGIPAAPTDVAVRGRARVVRCLLCPPVPASPPAERLRAPGRDVVHDGVQARPRGVGRPPGPRPAGAPARATRGSAGRGGPLHRPQLDHHCTRDRHQRLTQLRAAVRRLGRTGRWTRLARLGPSALTGSASGEEPAEWALVRFLGFRMPGAPVGAGHAGQDLGDVLAAAGPGGLATGPASDGSAHG